MASLALVTRSTAEMQTRKRRGWLPADQGTGSGGGARPGGPGGWARRLGAGVQAGGRCCDKGPAGTSRHRRDGAPASRDPEFPVSPQIPLRTGLHTVQLIRITRHTQSSRTLSPWHKRKWTLRYGQLARRRRKRDPEIGNGC